MRCVQNSGHEVRPGEGLESWPENYRCGALRANIPQMKILGSAILHTSWKSQQA